MSGQYTVLRPIVFAFLLLWPLVATGAEPIALDIEITTGGEAYRDAASGVDTTVTYYDPAAPAPEMVLSQPFDLEADEETDSDLSIQGGPRVVISIIIIAILIGLALAIARLSGVSSASFNRAPDRGMRTRHSGNDAQVDEVLPTTLSAIADIADRRLALLLMTSQTMQVAAAQCGFRIGRSWTLRDVIRRVPRDWHHHGALATLARAAEAVHFGGRDVAEDEFQNHFAAARTIIGSRA